MLAPLTHGAPRRELAVMADELQMPLARLVAAADDDLRRIERELHDVVQQHLVALTVNAQLVRELAAGDLPAALELLDDVTRDARAALEAVRTLAARVYPPLLLDRGLAEALRAAAAASPGPVQTELDGLDRHSEAVESAAYFCCLDALCDAGDAPVRLRVWQEDGALRLEVSPATLPAASTARERIAALGGQLDVEPGRVTAMIPLPQ
jgi:signal transduction histidine kinase